MDRPQEAWGAVLQVCCTPFLMVIWLLEPLFFFRPKSQRIRHSLCLNGAHLPPPRLIYQNEVAYFRGTQIQRLYTFSNQLQIQFTSIAQ